MLKESSPLLARLNTNITDNFNQLNKQLDSISTTGHLDMQLGQAFIVLSCLLIVNFLCIVVAWRWKINEEGGASHKAFWTAIYGMSKYTRKIVAVLAFCLAFAVSIVVLKSMSVDMTFSLGGIICKSSVSRLKYTY